VNENTTCGCEGEEGASRFGGFFFPPFFSFKKKGKQNKGVCHTLASPFTLKSILRQKKNYENSNISPCKNIIFKKNPLKQTKIFQDIITL